MAKRYELPDFAWEMIKNLVSPEQKIGRLRSNDRLIFNGIRPLEVPAAQHRARVRLAERVPPTRCLAITFS